MDKTFLIFGDSIAFSSADLANGWTQRLSEFLGKINQSDEDFYCVYNLAVPGNISDDILERFEFETKQRFDENEETIVIFAIGINDSQFIHSENKLRTPAKKFRENIKQSIAIAKKYAPRVIFIGLTPVDELKTDPVPWNTDKSFINENIEKNDKVIKEICAKERTLYVSIFDRFNKEDYKKLLEDGLHPNNEGHKIIFEIIKDFLTDKKII